MLIVIGLAFIVFIVFSIQSRKGPSAVLPYFCFFILLIPFNAKFDLGALPDLTVQRFSIVLFFLIYLIFRDRDTNSSTKIAEIPLFSLIIFASVTSLISSLLSINFMVSIKDWLLNVIEFYILYFLIVKSIRNREDVDKILI